MSHPSEMNSVGKQRPLLLSVTVPFIMSDVWHTASAIPVWQTLIPSYISVSRIQLKESSPPMKRIQGIDWLIACWLL